MGGGQGVLVISLSARSALVLKPRSVPRCSYRLGVAVADRGRERRKNVPANWGAGSPVQQHEQR